MTNSPETSSADTEASPANQISTACVDAGVGDPFVDFKIDPKSMDIQTFRGRAIELAGRTPTSQLDFNRILDFGLAADHFDAAKSAVGTYAYDESYEHRKFALKALAPFEQAANMLLSQLEKSEEAARIDTMQEFASNNPVVRGCCDG